MFKSATSYFGAFPKAGEFQKDIYIYICTDFVCCLGNRCSLCVQPIKIIQENFCVMRHIFCVSLQMEFIILVLSKPVVDEYLGCFYQQSAMGYPQSLCLMLGVRHKQ